MPAYKFKTDDGKMHDVEFILEYKDEREQLADAWQEFKETLLIEIDRQFHLTDILQWLNKLMKGE